MTIDGAPGAGLTTEQLAEEVTHLATPDLLTTPFGDLEFFDGVPKADSVQTIFDALDLLRGIDAFLTAVPGASLVAMRRGLRTAGVDAPDKIGYTDPRANSGSMFLTPNTETTYGTTFLDLKAWGRRSSRRRRSRCAWSTTSGSGTSPTWASPGPTRACGT